MKIIRMFSDRYPKVRVLIKSLATPKQVEFLRAGLIDVGFLTLPVEHEGLDIETILQERFLVAMPEHHPLSKRRRIPLRALANETMIIFPLHLSPGRHERTAEMCRRAGFSLHAAHEADNIYTMLEVVSAGFGISLMRASIKNTKKKGVTFRELMNSPVVETAVATRHGDQLDLLRHFVEVAKEITRPLSKTVRQKG